MNPKIVMCGCLETGWEVIKHLLENGVQISYFVTITKEKAGQQKVSGFADFSDLAQIHHIPIYYAEKYSLNSERDLAFFQTHQFDLLVQGGWQRLFPDNILATLTIGAIGIHGSSDFLPKGRGRSPINWSLIEGKKRFIIHYFIIKPGVDDGDVFHFDMFDINEWDTCRTLYYKNSIITKNTLVEWIPRLVEGNYTLKEQVGAPSYYPKRTAEDGLINWASPMVTIYNFVRALTHPYPGAFSFVEGKKMFIWKAQPFDTRIYYNGAVEGQIVEIFKTGDLVINASGGLLLITEYEYDGDLSVGMILE